MSDHQPVIDVKDLSHAYGDLRILDSVTLEVRPHESVAIVGPSGSGKTTLLGLLAGLEAAQTGSVRIQGQDLRGLDSDSVGQLRARDVGMVFQRFHLVKSLSAVENVALPLELQGDSSSLKKAENALEQVGMMHRRDATPKTLSGGESQRIAIARALVIEPKIILADEPTGNLDQETADQVSSLLFDQVKQTGVALALVTHSLQLAERCKRTLRLERGRLV
jgi:putative ABC transport system ATP-binding protein